MTTLPSALIRNAVVHMLPCGTAAVVIANPGSSNDEPETKLSIDTPAARFSSPLSGE